MKLRMLRIVRELMVQLKIQSNLKRYLIFAQNRIPGMEEINVAYGDRISS